MAETKPKPKGSLSGYDDEERKKEMFDRENLEGREEENGVKTPNILERAKEEFEAVFKSPRHHKETHGRNDDIDERTSVEEVKAPSVFGRMKEEIEAVVEAIHPKKESDTNNSPSK